MKPLIDVAQAEWHASRKRMLNHLRAIAPLNGTPYMALAINKQTGIKMELDIQHSTPPNTIDQLLYEIQTMQDIAPQNNSREFQEELFPKIEDLF